MKHETESFIFLFEKKMSNKQKIVIAAVAVIVAAAGWYLFSGPKKAVKQIDLEKKDETQKIINEGPVSPISGLPCENWNRRPLAVTQPSDVQARPAAGLSEADMVIELPAFTGSVTRLMGVYVCNIPEEIGAIRSLRHDNIHLAKGLDAILMHWGYSIFAQNILNKGVIDSSDCGGYCDRREATGKMRLEDTSRITRENVLKFYENTKYRTENNFPGYPHQEEAQMDQRPSGGHLRVAFKKPYDAEYDYDKETNSYLRTWGESIDTDRNNGNRIAPKNIAVIFAVSEQITLDQEYAGKGLEDPWAEVPEIKKTGAETINGRYNNLQLGDPWYDDKDSGDAFYYMNGKEYRGTWKKDRSSIDSKLFFYDESGQEMKFVPGQIWVEILEPGQALRWEPVA